MSKMIRCPFCKRYVVLLIKDEKIICPECGGEIKEVKGKNEWEYQHI